MITFSKSVQQVGVLPFVVTDAGVTVLLITSRRRRRWIVPKGWPGKGLTYVEAAEREALEEAGVHGPVHETPLGTFTYAKQMSAGYEIPSKVVVYPLLVLEHRLEWRERSERETAWHPLAKAAEIVDDRGLARLLHRLAKSDGRELRALAAAFGAPVEIPVTEDA